MKFLMVTSKYPNFVLITGVSRGFGLDTEKILKAAGHRVFATMREMNGWRKDTADNAHAGKILEIFMGIFGDANAPNLHNVGAMIAKFIGTAKDKRPDRVVVVHHLAQMPLTPRSRRFKARCCSDLDSTRSLTPRRSKVMRERYPNPPLYNWAGTLEFLKIRIGKYIGWIKVTHVPEKHALMMKTVASLAPVLPIFRERMHNLFDLTAQPDMINAHFGKHKRLKAMVAENPGCVPPVPLTDSTWPFATSKSHKKQHLPSGSVLPTRSAIKLKLEPGVDPETTIEQL